MLGKRSVAPSRMPTVKKHLLKKIITKVLSVAPVEETSINISVIYCEEVILEEIFFLWSIYIRAKSFIQQSVR